MIITLIKIVTLSIIVYFLIKLVKQKCTKRCIKLLLDYKRVLVETPDAQSLSVTLQGTKDKGTTVITTRPIKKGAVIMLYPATIFQSSTYKSPTDEKYAFDVVGPTGELLEEDADLIADVNLSRITDKPVDGAPFWGPFVNEPSEGQLPNVEIDWNVAYNYRLLGSADKPKPGNSFIYKIIAERDIKQGEELTWCYQPYYVRDYKVNKICMEEQQ